jgi:hypothetical protein
MTRPLGNVGTNWTPRVHDFYQRQVGTPASRGVPATQGNRGGAWQRTGVTYQNTTFAGLSGADAQTKLDSLVAVIIHDFHEHGTRAGMAEAAKFGLQAGARLYCDIRAESEERLSARLARIRSDLALSPGDTGAMVARAFVEARLTEVRAAVKDGRTPPQAVVDKPEIPRSEVAPWIPKAALAIGIIALLRSFRS